MDVYSELVESLERCIAASNNCAASCLDQEHVRAMSKCIKLNLDCSDTCHLTLKLLARNSGYAMSAVELCRNICAECAAECEKHEADHCQLCAKACRRCEDRCRKYLEHVRDTASLA